VRALSLLTLAQRLIDGAYLFIETQAVGIGWVGGQEQNLNHPKTLRW